MSESVRVVLTDSGENNRQGENYFFYSSHENGKCLSAVRDGNDALVMKTCLNESDAEAFKLCGEKLDGESWRGKLYSISQEMYVTPVCNENGPTFNLQRDPPSEEQEFGILWNTTDTQLLLSIFCEVPLPCGGESRRYYLHVEGDRVVLEQSNDENSYFDFTSEPY